MIRFNKTISNFLVLGCFILTITEVFYPSILNFGMNNYFLVIEENYIGVFLQFVLYQFLHGGILHLLSNSIFIFYFGNQLENFIGRNKYIVLFISNTIFTGIALLLFSSGNTIGISGFAMAVLSYMFMVLKKLNHPDYKSAGLLLVINIGIGLTYNISFVGHLAGAIFGILFYLLMNLTNKKTPLI